MSLEVIIHRGQNEIGGNCIEIISSQTRILLDIGQPLSGDPATLSQSQKTVDAVIISHPHQDHYGLIDQIAVDVPVYIGTTALKLIKALNIFMGKSFPERDFHPIGDLKPFPIGDLTITPHLVDHSAFDAYVFLVECCGERLFYTGDFRMHGRIAPQIRMSRLISRKWFLVTPRRFDNCFVGCGRLRRVRSEADYAS